MNNHNTFLYKLIKTECGRSKLEKLMIKKDILSRLRLIFFIVIASIRDFYQK